MQIKVNQTKFVQECTFQFPEQFQEAIVIAPGAVMEEAIVKTIDYFHQPNVIITNDHNTITEVQYLMNISNKQLNTVNEVLSSIPSTLLLDNLQLKSNKQECSFINFKNTPECCALTELPIDAIHTLYILAKCCELNHDAIIIVKPECSLHIATQEQLVNVITYTKHGYIPCIIMTHSPHIVTDKLQLLVRPRYIGGK